MKKVVYTPIKIGGCVKKNNKIFSVPHMVFTTESIILTI
jgi:hypothetical protein